MTATQAARGGSQPVQARVRAVLTIAIMAVAGGLLAEVGRQAEARDAQATYVRTAGPVTPSATAGG